MIVDTHAHLDADSFKCDLAEVLARAQATGVTRILAVGSDLASSRKAVELARGFEIVFAAVGIHPHEAERFDREAEAVKELLTEPKVVAVGEIGLDYFRGSASTELQRSVFKEQLEWAAGRGLPVSVHNRAADDDVLGLLRASTATAVLHCFSSDRAVAEQALSDGHMLSFAGNVTFPRAAELRDVVRLVPEDRLLVETDSPVLAPQSHRGRRNEPAYVIDTLRVLAETRDVPTERLVLQLGRNADRIFSWRSS